MNPHALVIGDVDNDNENEFVIGNLNGDLAIFKGQCEDGFPSYVCRGLGTNSVVIINAEGHAHIFDIPPKSKSSGNNADQQHISVDDYLRGGRRTSDTASIQAFRRVMSSNTMASASDVPPPQQQQQQQQQKPHIHDLGKPNLTLKVPVNVNKILIADIDHDDLNELILARTDRILHAFQLVPSDFAVPYDHVYKGIQTPSLASLSPSASTASLSGLGNSKRINLLDKNMWVFDGQISSLCTTTHPERPNEPLLLVAQPGNTFTIIDQDGNRFNRDFTPQHSNNTAYNAKHSSSAKRQSAPNDDSGSSSSTHFQRSNYVVKNWPVLDGGGNNNDDVIDDEIESGAVATEIVIGKRHVLQDSFSSSEVGMLSMDGKYKVILDCKFSIYDLKTKTTSQRDLFVTHKLFSLATLDVSAASSRPSNNRSRSSSKLSLNGLVNNSSKKQPLRHQHGAESSNEEEDENGDEDEDSSSVSDALSTTDDEDDSDYESVPWSEGSEMEDEEPGCDLFVACAWNGVTYLIDWSKKLDSDTSQDTIKYQLVKFAFEGRVCAFTAGLYSVENHVNVPCLFYVDFEDQIYVYYDVRISPGPVTGFIDVIDDDIEEALDRIMGIENGIDAQLKKKPSTATATTTAAAAANEEDGARIDLGDGWEGIADGLDDEDDDTSTHPHTLHDESQDTDPSSKYKTRKLLKCYSYGSVIRSR
ncbi:hypothetical protein FB192DRAFT_1279549 [Mucor lusitanicus]|uniref:Uncharacterized protein n=1 Tax=Mucor circinelloides f. lusitanicus TaxID=29924 RepID=A0A8H4BIX6_MUCCL|nr:hypothetical protein FB192DRAFT_1279549 [Mucor lusitanicus]